MEVGSVSKTSQVPFTILLLRKTVVSGKDRREVTSQRNPSNLLGKENSLKEHKHYYTVLLSQHRAIAKNHPADV